MKTPARNDTAIYNVPIFPLGMINAFILAGPKGCILIDAGLPDTEHKIDRVLKRINRDFGDIKLIVITHAHIDHAGNAATLKSLSGAKIVAHEDDLAYFRGEKKMHFCSTGWFGWCFSKTGAIQQPYQPFEPDILLESHDVFRLDDYGINGEVISTPGHTEGSISVIIDKHTAIVGDLISSGILLGGIIRNNIAKRPPFEDDPFQVARELDAIARKGAELFFMGHGGPLPKAEVLNHVERLRLATDMGKKRK